MWDQFFLNFDITQQVGKRIQRHDSLCLKVCLQILSYEPVFRDYLYESLDSFRRDNVQYLEIRAAYKGFICRNMSEIE